MDQLEELLTRAQIRCRLFLPIESVQGKITVEANVLPLWGELVARQQRGIVGVITIVDQKLGDVISARNSSCHRRRLPAKQEGVKECEKRIVLDVEFDADLLEVALNDRRDGKPWWEVCYRRVLKL